MDDRLPPIPMASIRRQRPFSAVWIVPVLAAIITLYIAWHSYGQSGETILIKFNSADGLVAGQTQIKYRAVTLGTVSEISLDSKLQKVLVKAKMSLAAKDILTDKSQFWIVRPRFAPGNISGIETLVSGSYIQCDPGESKGNAETSFTGLEEPPATRSDEHGAIFKLKTERLGSIGRGSPVYFRDINVGEVLSYNIGDGFEPIILTVFVREPYDKIVNGNSRFWNTSSLMVNVGPTGLQIQLQSLQALLSGGIAFSTPKKDESTNKKEETALEKDSFFKLYANKQDADIADFHKPIAFVSYFDNSFKNIGAGSPVYIKGIQVGEVTAVKLVMNYEKPEVKVQVHFILQPERAFLESKADTMDPFEVTRYFVDKGLRVKVDSGGLLPGQSGLALEFVPKAAMARAYKEGDAIVLPSIADSGGIEGIASALSDVAAKLNQIPIDRISENLNNLLTNANGAVKGIDPNSDMQRDIKRTLDQINDAARSVRLLTEFLSHHPESLIRGRGNKEGQ